MKGAVLLALLLAGLCFGEWPRRVITPKDDREDKPAAHDLAYFTQYPRLRDESGDFCYLCDAEQRLAEAQKGKARAEVREIGKFHGFAVADVLYYFDDETRPAWKSILVQTGPGSYQEIYHDQPNEGQPNASFVVYAGKEPLLCVADNIYKWDAEEDCFWFGAKGVVRLDFAPVWKAAQKAAPAGRSIWEYGLKARVSFEGMRLAVGMRYEDTGRCCDQGVVQVRFRLEQGRVTVVGTKFDPEAEYEW